MGIPSGNSQPIRSQSNYLKLCNTSGRDRLHHRITNRRLAKQGLRRKISDRAARCGTTDETITFEAWLTTTVCLSAILNTDGMPPTRQKSTTWGFTLGAHHRLHCPIKLQHFQGGGQGFLTWR